MKQFLLLFLTISGLNFCAAADAQSEAQSVQESRKSTPKNEKGDCEANPLRHCKSANFSSSDNPPTIRAIEVRFIDRDDRPVQGKTNPKLITQEFELEPGDTYDQKLAKSGLANVNELIIVDRASLEIARTGDGATIIVNVVEASSFFFVLGGTLPSPTALEGSIRPQSVVSSSDKGNGFSPSLRIGAINLGGENQGLTLGVAGGSQTFGLDLDYRKFINRNTGYAANLFTRSNVEPEFDEGEIDVDLPDGNDPWVERLGGGIEYFRPITGDWLGALGINYQLVSVRDAVFTSRLEPLDELGNQLTLSDNGQDELLTLSFVTSLDRRNDESNTTQGSRLLFSSDQSIPVGDASILYNRLAANYTQYLPLPLFGFTKGDRTLILNVQGGTILGDLPPYEAFSLGGSNSIRGYSGGEVGTGRSFIQATAEYRFPIFGFAAYNEKFDVGGKLFIDYGSVLSTQDNVTGQPGVVRSQTGSGLGYGLGLRTLTPVGVINLDFALNDEGDSEVIFKLGDRF